MAIFAPAESLPSPATLLARKVFSPLFTLKSQKRLYCPSVLELVSDRVTYWTVLDSLKLLNS